MSHAFVPTIRQIKDCFVEDVTDAGGTLVDSYEHGEGLFLRSILPITREIVPGDEMQAGVALKAVNEELVVHPYVFRQVCRNGAIVAQAIETRWLQRPQAPAGEDVLEEKLAELREAIASCSAEEAFVNVTDQMRAARDRSADMTVMMIAFLAHFPPHTRKYVIDQITDRQHAEGDLSQFGLMNAVTALARDTRDSEMRWRLEELGGAIGALLLPVPEAGDSGAALLLPA